MFIGVAVGLLPLVILGAFNLVLSGRAMRSAYLEVVEVLNRQVAERIQSQLDERERDVSTLALSPDLHDGGRPVRRNDLLRTLQATNKAYAWVGLSDRNGRIIAATDPRTIGLPVAERPWFRPALSAPGHSGVIRETLAGGGAVISFAAPVRDRAGRVQGVLCALMAVSPVTVILQQGRLGETGESYLVDREGLIVTGSRFADRVRGTMPIDTAAMRGIRSGRPGSGIYRDYRDMKVLGAYAPLRSYRLGVITEIDADEGLENVAALQRAMVWALLIAGLIGAALALDRGRLVERLRAAIARAEAERTVSETALRVRDDFLSMASHELKTPVAALKLQFHAMEKDLAVVPKLAGRLPGLRRQLLRIEYLVRELLDETAISRDALPVHRRQVAVATLTAQVVAEMAEMADAAGCEVRTHLADVICWADPQRLEHVLINLLSNAFKFGAGQPVDVQVSERAGQAVISIRDRGVGIDPAQSGQLFQRFGRLQSTQHFGGFGLGLWISQALVQRMAGTIEVISDVAPGAMFEIRLPLTAPPDRSSPG
jgi:signal transduction histidine kinase